MFLLCPAAVSETSVQSHTGSPEVPSASSQVSVGVADPVRLSVQTYDDMPSNA